MLSGGLGGLGFRLGPPAGLPRRPLHLFVRVRRSLLTASLRSKLKAKQPLLVHDARVRLADLREVLLEVLRGETLRSHFFSIPWKDGLFGFDFTARCTWMARRAKYSAPAYVWNSASAWKIVLCRNLMFDICWTPKFCPSTRRR